ncbi:hypothetical protein Pmar_PMAR007447 [Perkinsus marinus ATCC 50983]|uniref:Uncharacterized protein n=1 Tax=Perkinsus marinus (strain ATCC 50983 / TXsc) TaxID=423536 RepID=C5L983_PERM5|nr:hypothetical protein Pmar_PMAR007447 [Perkinsus marinus ATCC 50983]EER06731.1 hypothetical protein Pmar_PMAR007447 [Perkinsus marinus ATCC 50983]|eukprot:XP_002774915.1 hypothetical protein Pmar_PMAR007447 [Perkinsus marinus ATCC 50983]
MTVKADDDQSPTHGSPSERPFENRFPLLDETLYEVAQNETKLPDLLDEKPLRKLAEPELNATQTEHY